MGWLFYGAVALCFLFLGVCGLIFLFQKTRFVRSRKSVRVLHYTRKENVEPIMRSQKIKASKDGHVYFFIGQLPTQEKLKKNKLTDANVIITIDGVTELQAKKFGLDLRSDVFAHKGDFSFHAENKITVWDRAILENLSTRQRCNHTQAPL